MKARTQPRVMLPPIPPQERVRMRQKASARQDATPAPFTVTLEFTPAAHALLVAMAQEQEHATVRELILAELASNVTSWMEGMGKHGDIKEWFTGADQPKEAA